MSQIFDDYCQKLQADADTLALEAETNSRLDHHYAFNFGRSVGRFEQARDTFWVRLRWLLLGAAVGVAGAAIYLQLFLSDRIMSMPR